MFHARRHLGVDRAFDKALLLHLAQTFGQHFLQDSPERALELPKPFGAAEQVAEDKDGPLVANERQRGLDRARR